MVYCRRPRLRLEVPNIYNRSTVHLHLDSDLNMQSKILLLSSLVGFVYCQTKVEQSDDGNSGTISFSTPDLNDDEAHSPWVPDRLKCDACKIVSYQLWMQFEKYNNFHKYKKYNLPESEIIDITEEVCDSTELFNSYGIKQVDKVNRLTGPGTDTADMPGVIAGGGRWPARLKDLCNQFMGQIGEDKIYSVYKKDPKSRSRLDDFLCLGPKGTVRGECLQAEDTKPLHDDEDDEEFDKDEL